MIFLGLGTQEAYWASRKPVGMIHQWLHEGFPIFPPVFPAFFCCCCYQLLHILPLATREDCSILLGSSSVHRHLTIGAATRFSFPVYSFCSETQQQVPRHSVPAPETVSDAEVISGTSFQFLIQIQKIFWYFPFFFPLCCDLWTEETHAENYGEILT